MKKSIFCRITQAKRKQLRVLGLVLSGIYQKLVLYVFSNETFPFFAKLEGLKLSYPPSPYGGVFWLNVLPTLKQTEYALKTGHLISTKSVYAFAHNLKLWLSCETCTVSKVLLIKCKTFETVSYGEWKGWKFTISHNVCGGRGGHYYH